MSDHPVATSEELYDANEIIVNQARSWPPGLPKRLDDLGLKFTAIEQDAALKEAVQGTLDDFKGIPFDELMSNQQCRLRMAQALATLIPTLSQRPEIPT
jgi:hypothetical protein